MDAGGRNLPDRILLPNGAPTLPEPPAWGSNFAVITVRNSDERPHEIEIDSRCSAFSVSRNFQRQTKQTLAAGAQAAIEHEFWVPAFPGKMAHRLRLTDLDTRTRFFVHVYEAEFPLANSRVNPFNAVNRIYPRLRMAERGDTDRGRFAKIFGVSLEDVEKAWLARLGTSAVEPVPESKVSAVRAKYVPAP